MPVKGGWFVWDKRCGVVPQRTYADGELGYCSFDVPLRIFRYLWDGFLQENMKCKEKRIHAAQKPVELIKSIIAYYVKDTGSGSKKFLVCDPFGGSGSTAVACWDMGYDCITIERDVDIAALSTKRITDARSQLKLFT